MTARWRRAPDLAAILAVALIVRLVVVAITSGQDASNDAADYLRHVRSIAEHGTYPDTLIAAPGSPTALRPPALPYLMGAVAWVTHSFWVAPRIAAALLGTLTVWLIFRIGGELWDRRVAVVAAAIAAVFPPLVVLNASLISEALFVPLELAAVLGMLVARRRGAPPLALAAGIGVLCGLAALTRQAGAFMVLPAAIALLTVPGWPRRRALAAVAAVAACTALVVAPWTVRNARELHAFVPVASQGGLVLAGVYNPSVYAYDVYPAAWRPPNLDPTLRPLFYRRGINEAQLNGRLNAFGKRFAREHPRFVVKVVVLSTLRLFNLGGSPSPTAISYDEMGVPQHGRWLVTGSGFVVFALALAGIVALARRRAARPPWWVWLVPLLLIAPSVIALGAPRYRAQLDPFLVLLAAVALTHRRRARIG